MSSTSNSNSSGGTGQRSQKRKKTSSAPTSQSDSVRSGLVSLNKLDYNLSPDLSVAVQRNYKRHFAQQALYTPSQRAIIIANSGAEYVDPGTSALVFSVKNLSTDEACNFGSGSCANLIRRIILTSRSGDEIERIERVNLLAPILDRFEHDKNWLDTIGSMAGYNSDVNSPSTVIAAGATTRFVLPLACVSGLFRNFDRLLPSMLMSGLRFEIEWERSDVALKYAATPASPGYEVTELQLALDSYTLTDSVQRTLNETAALSGLEVVFASYHNSQHSPPSSGSKLNVEVRKAVSRALAIYCKSHSNQSSDTEDVFDSMSCSQWNFRSMQVRVGSLYFPQQTISRSTAADALREMYFQTMRGFNKLKAGSAPPSVSVASFNSTDGVYCQDLERSSVQQLTGVPINNSRTLEVIGEYDGAVGDTIIDLYLVYTRLARVFLNNIEVAE